MYNGNSYYSGGGVPTGPGPSSTGTFRRFNDYQYDADEEQLVNKTNKLKQVTISLGQEIRDSNRLLNDLDSDMDKSKGFLSMTMNQVLRLSRSGGNCRIYFYLILFSLFVLFVLYIIIKWR